MNASPRAVARGSGLIICAALATHLHVLWGGWVRDDYALILTNPAIRRLATIPAQCTEPFLGLFWRPSVTISYTLEYALWGLRPAGFHATNLLLHCTAAVLVAALWRRFSDRGGVALGAGLLFAVHGAHYQPAVIADRTGLLATTFGLLAWYCAHRAGARGGGARVRALAWAGAGLLAYVVALGAKEEAVVLPLLMLVVGVVRARPSDGPAPWRAIGPCAGVFAVLAVGYLVVRSHVLAGPGLVAAAWPALPQRVLSLPAWLLHHWRDALIPLWLDVDYRGLVWPHLSRVWGVASAGVVVGVCAGAWRLRRRFPELLLGLVWFLLAWLPTSNVIPIYTETADKHVFMPPHFLYFPNAAFAGVVATLGVVVLERRRGLGRAVVAGFLLLHAVTAVRMNAVWKDDVRLYRYVLRAHPQHPQMWRNLGLALANRGRYAEAAEAYDRSIRAYPSAEAYLGQALVQEALDDRAHAVRSFRSSIDLAPTKAEGYLGLAQLQQEMGDVVGARDTLRQGLAARADAARLLEARARLEQAAGNVPQARGAIEEALDLEPDSAALWNTLGTILADAGDRSGARAAWLRAERLAPGLTPAAENLRLLEAAR